MILVDEVNGPRCLSVSDVDCVSLVSTIITHPIHKSVIPTAIIPSNSAFISIYLYTHRILRFSFHTNGGPKNQQTTEYRMPFVTGATLCSIDEGNTIIEPVVALIGVIVHFPLL